MQRSILVRVVDSGGRPVKDASVTFYVYQFAASGSKGPYSTNSSGEVEISIDTDQFAEGEVSVNGKSTGRRSIQGTYRLQV